MERGGGKYLWNHSLVYKVMDSYMHYNSVIFIWKNIVMIKRYVLLLTIKLLPVSRFFHTKRLLLKWAGVDIGNNVSFCGGGGIYGKMAT